MQKICSVPEEVSRALAGDQDAFTLIYELYHGRILALITRKLRRHHSSAADPADLVQEVFLKAFKKLDTFRGEAKFSTWLYRIAVREVWLHFRKRYVCTEVTVLDDPAGVLKETVSLDPTKISSNSGRISSSSSFSISGASSAAYFSSVARSLENSIAMTIDLPRLISQLPPRQQKSLKMRMENLDSKQIAQELGISDGADRLSTHRGRTKLKRALNIVSI